MTKSDKIREYFRKHPDADVAKVAAKFDAPKPMTYKLRKQVQEWDQLITTPTPSGRKVTISASQLAIADKLGIDHNTFIEHALKAGVIQYDEPEADINNLLYIDAPRNPPAMAPETTELGRKFDAGKLDYTLVPFEGLEEIIKVLMFGAQKYDRHNWKHVDNAPQRYTAAAFRHLAAHTRGEMTDHETGLSHLAHAGCCVLFLLALEQQRES